MPPRNADYLASAIIWWINGIAILAGFVAVGAFGVIAWLLTFGLRRD